MSRMSLRTAASVVLTLVVLGLAGAGLTLMVRSAHDRSDVAGLATLARKVELPAGATAVSGLKNACPTGQYLRCGTVDLSVDEAAAQMRATVEVEAEQRPALRCQTLPNRQGLKPRDCLIQISRGRQAFSVSVQEWPFGTVGQKALIKVENPSPDY